MIKILNIDDDPIALMLNKIALKKCENTLEVIDCEDGSLALDFIKNNSQNKEVYILLLDINMPKMNAWQLLDTLVKEKLNHQVKTSIVSSSIDKIDRERAFSYPCVLDYMVKPINATDMKQFLSKALNSVV